MTRRNAALLVLGCIASLLGHALPAHGRAGRGGSYNSGSSSSDSSSRSSSKPYSGRDSSSKASSPQSSTPKYVTPEIYSFVQDLSFLNSDTTLEFDADSKVRVTEKLRFAAAQLDGVLLHKLGFTRDIAVVEYDQQTAPSIVSRSGNVLSAKFSGDKLLITIDKTAVQTDPEIVVRYDLMLPVSPQAGARFVTQLMLPTAAEAAISFVHGGNPSWQIPELYRLSSKQMGGLVSDAEKNSVTGVYRYAFTNTGLSTFVLVQDFGSGKPAAIKATKRPWRSTRLQVEAKIHPDQSLTVTRRFITKQINATLHGVVALYDSSFDYRKAKSNIVGRYGYLLRNTSSEVVPEFYGPTLLVDLKESQTANAGVVAAQGQVRYDVLGSVYGSGERLQALIFASTPFRYKGDGRPLLDGYEEIDGIDVTIELPSFLNPAAVAHTAEITFGPPKREVFKLPIAASTDGRSLKFSYATGLPASAELGLRLDFPSQGFAPVSLLTLSSWRWSNADQEKKTKLIAAVAIAVSIAFLILFLRRWSRRRRKLELVLSAQHRAEVDAKEKAMARRAGEDFDAVEFLELCKKMATEVQSAWSAGDMRQARLFVSQGLQARLAIQIQLMRETEGVKNVMADFTVHNLSFKAVHETGEFQTIDVLLRCSARDDTVPAHTPASEVYDILSQAPSTDWDEVYSFTRRKGINAKGHVVEGTCPSCGDGIERATDFNKCRSCGIIFNSGYFDWVLTEITQTSDWRPREPDAPRVSQHAQVIEDRASYLFWRYLRAVALGRKTDIEREVTDGFEPGGPLPIKEPVVGAVDLAALTETPEGIVSAEVHIEWSVGLDGQKPKHQTTKLILTGPLKHLTEKGFSAPGCSQCGAPTNDLAATVCGHCGAKVSGKVHDLLIDAVIPPLAGGHKKAVA